ncbi:MAG: hypothetical protein Q9185_003569 [Variospora sp. 1 TL-2023]
MLEKRYSPAWFRSVDTDDGESLPVAANPINPPPTITKQIKDNGPGVPPDTIVFTFDNVPMAADDVTMAIITTFKVACERLSAKAGKEDAPVDDEFRVRDEWYRFELGWDHDVANDKPFLITELRTIIVALDELNRNYNMRQLTFTYLLAGRFHVIGRLRNPPVPPAPRHRAIRPVRMSIPDGHVLWTTYGRPMDFSTVADAMMGLLINCWDTMVEMRKPAYAIISDTVPLAYLDVPREVKLEVWAPPLQLSLHRMMDMAYYAVDFGRVFFMVEHHCALVITYYPAPLEVTSVLSREVVEKIV